MKKIIVGLFLVIILILVTVVHADNFSKRLIFSMGDSIIDVTKEMPVELFSIDRDKDSPYTFVYYKLTEESFFVFVFREGQGLCGFMFSPIPKPILSIPF